VRLNPELAEQFAPAAFVYLRRTFQTPLWQIQGVRSELCQKWEEATGTAFQLSSVPGLNQN
jgi:hypothetical protein